MKIRADSIIRVPAGARLGLNYWQFRARSLRVEVFPPEVTTVDDSSPAPLEERDEIILCTAKETLEFKAGEELRVFGIAEGALRKFIAGQVTVIETEAPENTPKGDGSPQDGTDEATGAEPSAAPAPASKSGKAKKTEKPADGD